HSLWELRRGARDFGVDQRIVLPAEEALNQVATRITRMRGFLDPRHRERAHDISETNSGQISVVRDPFTLRRIHRQAEIAEQNLAVGGERRDRLFSPAEQTIVDGTGGTRRQTPLSIHTACHVALVALAEAS